MSDPALPQANDDSNGRWTRDYALTVVLVVATALLLYGCWLLAAPFISPLMWALAIAIVAHPVHRWLQRKVKNENVAAGLAVLILAVVVAGMGVFVVGSVMREVGSGIQGIQAALEENSWRERLARMPRLQSAVAAIESRVDLGGEAKRLTAEVATRVSAFIAGSAWAVVGFVLMLFMLFFFFRDWEKGLVVLRSLVPLSEREASEVFKRLADTIHATIYGTLVVAAVQGALGGLMFWWLGLPAPVLWGAVMALLSIIPVLGAFVIWVPAALFLAASGEVGKAAILTAWGAIVVALVDNLLYPVLVGKRLRLHTLPVFLSILGGLSVFGTVGLVVGPAVLALTDTIIEIWRRRTAHGRSAEATMAALPQPAHPPAV